MDLDDIKEVTDLNGYLLIESEHTGSSCGFSLNSRITIHRVVNDTPKSFNISAEKLFKAIEQYADNLPEGATGTFKF